MKSSIFWDITPCSPLKVNRRFGETYRLHCSHPRRQYDSSVFHDLLFVTAALAALTLFLPQTLFRGTFMFQSRTCELESSENVETLENLLLSLEVNTDVCHIF
jgi:hypothetical protein